MPAHPSASVQQAREALAGRVREIREDTGSGVHADTLDAASTLTRPGQVGLYARAFDRLSRGAVRGAAVRSLVAGALACLD
ncbi:hypothetical protein [Kitasatospora sp. NPDC091276]|uniref:hypothetical protein n=1 Tax=unclassified Kitasatospora TaxID=2633591 RepID=UPI0034181E00